MRRAVALSSRRSYRDTISREFIASLGIDTSIDRVVPDLVFGIAKDRVPHRCIRASDSRTVGVGVMSYHGWRGDAKTGMRSYSVYVENMVWLVEWLREAGFSVRLLTGEVGTDDRAVEDVAQRLNASGVGSLPVQTSPIRSFNDLLVEIAACDFVVATRFHNLIAAMILGVPCVSVGYAGKFDALMGAMGLADYCQRTDSINRSLLVHQFQSLSSSGPNLSVSIQGKAEQYRRAVESHLDDVIGFHVGSLEQSC